MARLRMTPDMDPTLMGGGNDLLDPTEVDPIAGAMTGEEGGVHGGPVGPAVPYNPVVTIQSGPQTVPPEPPPPVPPVTPPEPPLPAVPAGPVPGNDEVLPLATPPPPQTATGLPTFGVGGSVSRGLRTPTFRSNRVVGGAAEDTLLNGITGRFGPGIPVAQAPLPSGLTGDTSDATSSYTDDDLLKRSILGRR